MEILPSDYDRLTLSSNEKKFVHYIEKQNEYGYLILQGNPTMQENDSVHILIIDSGVIVFKFFEEMKDASLYSIVMGPLIDTVYKVSVDILTTKITENQALIDKEGKLLFPVNLIYCFPNINRKEIEAVKKEKKIDNFTSKHCFFNEDLRAIRNNYSEIIQNALKTSIMYKSSQLFSIDESNINSILQRLAPEYVTIRISKVVDEDNALGADNEKLVVKEGDLPVKAYRLDKEQINIVNKIKKGEQLILACAGSGKSVLLISKCFKAAEMNPNKKFLITCYNKNLQSLYTWFIDQAGFSQRNVKCVTFHKLCKLLLQENNIRAPYGGNKEETLKAIVNQAIYSNKEGKINTRYYGIFIDEVQIFEQDWYKLCYDLLEHKDSDDHIFVICGDKTQDIKNAQRHGKAPWNAGDKYPCYRGGNKNICIEKNYRNCIEINEYINRFVESSKAFLKERFPNEAIDGDSFLRGDAVYHGNGVALKRIFEKNNNAEGEAIIESIEEIHDNIGIPYDEIAVIMNNSSYKFVKGWKNKTYSIDNTLARLCNEKDIPFNRMYKSDDGFAAHYGESSGVKFIRFDSTLGLDFRAAIICGLVTLGEYDKTKSPKWHEIKQEADLNSKTFGEIYQNIRRLYVGCTRAKEVLHIIIPEDSYNNIYLNLLESAVK